jgi:hypothetical protein
VVLIQEMMISRLGWTVSGDNTVLGLDIGGVVVLMIFVLRLGWRILRQPFAQWGIDV